MRLKDSAFSSSPIAMRHYALANIWYNDPLLPIEPMALSARKVSQSGSDAFMSCFMPPYSSSTTIQQLVVFVLHF